MTSAQQVETLHESSLIDGQPATSETPDVFKPPPGNPRFPLIDSLRALAAFAVVITHTSLLAGANTGVWWGTYTARFDIGVTVFFLLSGFLLYRPFVAARMHEAKPIRIRDYTRRRLLRIVPAYWLALTVLGIYPGLPGIWDHNWWVYYLFLQIYNGTLVAGGIFPAWSLCVEISFYLLLPFYVLLATRLLSGLSVRRQMWCEFGLLTLLGAASVAFRFYVRAELGTSFWANTLPTLFLWFALGMAVAVFSATIYRTGKVPRPAQWIGRFPLACWLSAAVIFWFVSTQVGLPLDFTPVDSNWKWIAQYVLYGFAAFFFVLPAMIQDHHGGIPRKLLAFKPLAWLGLISYGVFLWHSPILNKLTESGASEWIPGSPFLSLLLPTVGITLICATLSYYLVEKPLLRFKDWSPRRKRESETQSAKASA